MEKDKFDIKLIEIESKSFEITMLMSGFVLEILGNFHEMKSDIQAELPFYDPDRGYRSINSKSIFYNPENGLLALETDELQTPVIWDDLNVAAKEILINELLCKYKSLKIFKSLSGTGEMH